MKAASIRTLVLILTCALAIPFFGQQKTYNWTQGNDETVRLDPGYYHTSPAYQPASGSRSMHVDIDAKQPVTLAVVSAQAWSEAGQRPEAMSNLRFLCLQEHVLQTTYTCDLPLGLPMLLLVRDERNQGGAFAGLGEVIRGRDHDKHSGDADADRDRAIAAGVEAALGGRGRQQFSYPNDVHIQYYDWSCTQSCDLPDPPRPKLFDWVPGNSELSRLDPGEFFHGATWAFASRDISYHFDLEARWPVTIAVVRSDDWYDAMAQRSGKTLANINYICLQQHVVSTTFTCNIPVVMDTIFMVVHDERDPLPPNQYTQYGQTTSSSVGQAATQTAGQPATPPSSQTQAQKVGQPPNQASRPGAPPFPAAASANAVVADRNAPRPFLAPNDIRMRGYTWRCVDACDQPDFAWASLVSEKYTLTRFVKVYGGTVIPDHDGEQVSIRVKSPVPMAVAMLPAKVAGQLYAKPDSFEPAVENSSCAQRGVQESTFQCTFNIADGPQSLVLVPETGVDIPLKKKAEVEIKALKCVDNCPNPDFAWVSQVHEKYHPTHILKVYGGIAADHDGEQVSVRVKSPVPMAVAMLPAKVAGQLYGKPDMFEAEVRNSSCEQRSVQESTLQCTFNVGDGPQSLVLVPEPGAALPPDKKTEVEVQAMQCVAKCDSLGKTR